MTVKSFTALTNQHTELFTMRDRESPTLQQAADDDRALSQECQYHWLQFPWNWTLQANLIKATNNKQLSILVISCTLLIVIAHLKMRACDWSKSRHVTVNKSC